MFFRTDSLFITRERIAMYCDTTNFHRDIYFRLPSIPFFVCGLMCIWHSKVQRASTTLLFAGDKAGDPPDSLALASDFALASAFFFASHSSFGIWPCAWGQYRWPLNWVWPSVDVGWPQVRQLYNFLVCLVLFLQLPFFIFLHSVVLETETVAGTSTSTVTIEVSTMEDELFGILTFAVPTVSLGSVNM